MEPYVISLMREDFERMPNAGLVDSAMERRTVIDAFFAETVINHPVVIMSENMYGQRVGRYFERVDFTRPRFVYAIEDWVISGSRQILGLAPERGLNTALNQIFGKHALGLIAEGEMDVPNKKSREGKARIDLSELMARKTIELSNVIKVDFAALRAG